MLVLASASKARHKLLEEAMIPHIVIVSNFDENSVKETNPKKLVEYLSHAKASEVASNQLKAISHSKEIIKENIILGCDSVFEFEGQAFGKPRNPKEAIQRLRALSSKSGYLHTGHTLIINNNEKQKNLIIRSIVKSTYIEFCKLENNEIQQYVESGEPLQCAGCFTLEGKGAKFIKSINGCFTNVLGLSIPWLKENLLEIKNQ